MRYLSIDIESTGLEPDALIIEFAMVPIDTDEKKIYLELAKETYIHCPSYEELKPSLSSWVAENNKDLITKAHKLGIKKELFATWLSNNLESPAYNEFFKKEKIILFGKSMSSIDIPFLKRDLGWSYLEKYFSHRNLDLSSVVYHEINANKLPKICESGSKLMKHFGMGDVAHTALEDAVNTAKLYFNILSNH